MFEQQRKHNWTFGATILMQIFVEITKDKIFLLIKSVNLVPIWAMTPFLTVFFKFIKVT